MGRYILSFSKQGFLRFTSHLDLMRLFKRVFKRVDLPLDYSKGFNPHPRMSFAQPLSLGYTAKKEFLEFHTYEDVPAEDMLLKIRRAMPTGITIFSLEPLDIQPKTLASIVCGARYVATYPLDYERWSEKFQVKLDGYLAQDSIIAMKKQKKTKELKEQDIKYQIGNIRLSEESGKVSLIMDLDSGSASNLSPELVIETFKDFSGIEVKREDIMISREFLYFEPMIPKNLGLHVDYERCKE